MTDQPVTPQPQPTPPAAKPAVLAQPMTRRAFLSWLALGWIAFLGAFGVFAASIQRFLFPNVNFDPPSTFKAGLPGDYEIGVVDERWKEKYGVWIVRNDKILYALSTVCTHLGCTPNWLSTEEMFKCPCHGSGFKKTGINFEGPAPRPLERYRVAMEDDGQVLVDKSRKFQYEKGQWKDPESFIKVA